MEDQPLVSVIIPVYQVEKTLPKCVNSILQQTFDRFEVILVDDGSPDESGSICNKFSKLDKRVVVIHQKNQGVSAARNNGISNARGKYILFIDSDDYVESDYIEKLYDNRTDFTSCGIVKENEKGDFLSSVEYTPYAESKVIDYEYLYKCSEIYSPYCKLFLSSIIKSHSIRFPVGIHWGEDGMFVADYLEYIHSVKYLDYVGYHYIRYNEKNTLSSALRIDILDDVAFTREYCINKVNKVAPLYYSRVKEIITENIVLNCAAFIVKVFNGSLLFKRKMKLLDKYLQNDYVQKSIYEKPKYYSKTQLMALKYKNARFILIVYFVLKKAELFKGYLRKQKNVIQKRLNR